MYIKRKIITILSFSLLFATVLSSFQFPSTAEAASPHPDAGAFVLMEKEDKKIISQSNASLPLPIASTTKIMTCIVVLERCDPEETVIVHPSAAGVEGSSAYLRAGEHMAVLDLLYCLMLQSANDAAAALAFHVAGSIEEFAGLMNEKARELGLENSHFTNPHGLDHQSHYASAYDLALLCAEGLNNPLFSRIVSTKSIVIGTGEHRRVLTNHNKLLFSLEGCIGVKTGYTIRSGRCLVSACTRQNTTLICVTLSCKNDWETHADLYDYGFSRVKRFTFAESSYDLPIWGTNSTLHVRADGFDILASPTAELSVQTVCPHFIIPPVQAGEEIGYLLIKLDGNTIDVLPITACEDALQPPHQGFIARIISGFLAFFTKK